jgi:hypothetical protein
MPNKKVFSVVFMVVMLLYVFSFTALAAAPKKTKRLQGSSKTVKQNPGYAKWKAKVKGTSIRKGDTRKKLFKAPQRNSTNSKKTNKTK